MKQYTLEELKALERDGWSEETFQGKVLQMAKGYGWKAVHFLPAMTGRIGKNGKPHARTPYQGQGGGFPDTIAIRVGVRGVGLAWELKCKKNVATPEQLDWLDDFNAVGFDTGVFWPKDWDSMMDFLEKGKR